MRRYAVRRSLLLAPLWQHKGRLALSVLAIALGVALGYAVQLINQAAINEFAAAVQTLSGEADLARGPRTARSASPPCRRSPERPISRCGVPGRVSTSRSTRVSQNCPK